MNDKQLYQDFVHERQQVYGSKRVKQEKQVRKKHFFSKKKKIESLIQEAKSQGMSRDEAIKYVDSNLSSGEHIYGSLTFLIIEAIISWLIKKLMDRYFESV